VTRGNLLTLYIPAAIPGIGRQGPPVGPGANRSITDLLKIAGVAASRGKIREVVYQL
jgi:hypothetical protein